MKKIIKRFARIPTIPGEVVEVFSGTKLFPMHPDLIGSWYVVPEEVQEFWTYDGFKYSPPVKLPSRQDSFVDPMTAKLDGLTAELAKVQIETSKQIKELAEGANQSQMAIIEIKAAMLAVKGFMMMLPDIQKSLREIKEVLASKDK